MKKILLIIGGILLLLFIVSLFLPSHIHVERSIVINAPAAKVFNELNSLQKWGAWDPWQKKDPKIVNIYSGPKEGVGNKNEWKSEVQEVGSGSQEITESVPNEKIVSKLIFGPGRDASGSFLLSAEGEGTKAVWGMDMDMGFSPAGKYFGLFMDKMMGPEFENGLATLKTLVESIPDEVAPADSLGSAVPAAVEN